MNYATGASRVYVHADLEDSASMGVWSSTRKRWRVQFPWYRQWQEATTLKPRLLVTLDGSAAESQHKVVPRPLANKSLGRLIKNGARYLCRNFGRLPRFSCGVMDIADNGSQADAVMEVRYFLR